MTRWILLLALFSPLLGCSGVPQPPPGEYDAGAQEAAPEASQDVAEPCPDPVACACQNLCDLGCSECDPGCQGAIEQILVDRVMIFSPECVAGAKTKAAVRFCPGIWCN